MALDAKQEDVTKFGSCSDAGSCCKPRAIPIPELTGHLLPSLSQSPVQFLCSKVDIETPSHLLRLQGGLVQDPQTNRDTPNSQEGEVHGIRTCTFEQLGVSVPLLQQELTL